MGQILLTIYHEYHHSCLKMGSNGNKIKLAGPFTFTFQYPYKLITNTLKNPSYSGPSILFMVLQKFQSILDVLIQSASHLCIRVMGMFEAIFESIFSSLAHGSYKMLLIDKKYCRLHILTDTNNYKRRTVVLERLENYCKLNILSLK